MTETVCDEKKEDNPMEDTVPEKEPLEVETVLSDDEADISPPLPKLSPKTRLTPSKLRAKDASSAGLSELSKQLRILQAKNEAQSVEINRLERQLRILAELQGISVADLRKALEDACASEAFGEMQHRVAKLRAELEAANLARQKELRTDATAPHIANLELRVGELEEVEEKHQAEIHHLFEQLRHERARSTRLEAESQQHKKEAEDLFERLKKETARASRLEFSFQGQLQKTHEEQAQNLQNMAKMAKEAEALKNGKNGQVITPDMAAEYARMAELLKARDKALLEAEERLKQEQMKWFDQKKENEGQALQTQTDMKVDKDKMALTIKELQEADSQSELRLAQFRARFNVQDERIQDMDQQLSSLYTAFGIIKEEQEAEDTKREALKSSLDDADLEVARQVEDLEKRQSQRNLMSPDSQMAPSIESENHQALVPYGQNPSHNQGRLDDAMIRRSLQSPHRVPSTITTPTSGAMASSRGMGSRTPTASVVATPTATAQPLVSPQRTPGTWQLLFPEPHTSRTPPDASGVMISGVLIVKSKSLVRSWRSKYSKLYLRGNHYQLDMDGKSFMLGFGVSKVEFYPNHPLAFTVYTNPFDGLAPVVHAATTTEEEYHRWMAALTKATTGGEYHTEIQESAPRRLDYSSPNHRASATSQYSSAESIVSGLSIEDQETADLQRALRLSRAMT